MKKPIILIVSQFYLPGYKAGGPIQSIKNLIINLSKEMDFKVLTLDRDLGDEKPYKNMSYNKWEKLDKCLVKYITPQEMLSLKYLKETLVREKYNLLYLNSSFSLITIKILLLKKFRMIPEREIIVAPRGEYSPGALTLKKNKKNFFLKVSKALRLYKNVTWQATTEEEKKMIIEIQGKNTKVIVAENLKEIKDIKKQLIKEPKKLKLIFASRISPKKNLKMCLEILKKVDLKGIEFNIVGPIEDSYYWKECQKEIKKLKNVKVNYLGMFPNEKLLKILSEHHYFFFPTLGENFGHIILESLIAKTPLIISDQTPWKKLNNKNIGWDIPLEKESNFINVIKEVFFMNNEEYSLKIKDIQIYIDNYSQNREIENNKKLFKGI